MDKIEKTFQKKLYLVTFFLNNECTVKINMYTSNILMEAKGFLKFCDKMKLIHFAK